MMVSPFVFKSRAIRALKGNWQTALLVSFFASILLTLIQLVQATRMPELPVPATPEALRAAVDAIAPGTWTLLGLLGGLSLVLSPMLAVGCNNYFLCRLRKQELGFAGLFSRANVTLKALGMYLVIYVRVFLWSLLLVAPGIMAALRYSMAPFYLAEHPEMGALEAIRKSKEVMRGQKMSLFMLEVSFLAWLLAALLCEMFLSGISVIFALVVSQFIQLAMATYLNASTASFYLAVSEPGGLEKAQLEAAGWLRTMGAGDVSPWVGRSFGSDDNDEPDASVPEEKPDAADDEPAGEDGESPNTQTGEETREGGDTPKEDGRKNSEP